MPVRIVVAAICFLALALLACTPGPLQEAKEAQGPYLGQQPPDSTPRIFAPGLVSRGWDERMAMFTPDGRQIYFQVRGAPHSVVFEMHETGGAWSDPAPASFSGSYFEEFGIAPDGRAIVFCSNRPLDGKGPPGETFRTWITRRQDGGWTDPVYLGQALDGAGYPSISQGGNIYFFDKRPDGRGEGDIYVSELKDGAYQEARNLGPSINSEHWEVDPYIAPDESYVVFASHRPEEGGLFVSFRSDDGRWLPARYLGDEIGKGETICPFVTSDGRFLFFTSRRRTHRRYSEQPISWDEKRRALESPGNGSNDIYWVSAEVITRMRRKENGK